MGTTGTEFRLSLVFPFYGQHCVTELGDTELGEGEDEVL